MECVRSTTLLKSAGLGAGARRCANRNSASASTIATENVLTLIEYLNDARAHWPTQTISRQHSDRRATPQAVVETQRAASRPEVVAESRATGLDAEKQWSVASGRWPVAELLAVT